MAVPTVSPKDVTYLTAEVAATGVAFTKTANAVYITATTSSGLSLTMEDSSSVAFGNVTIGTIIPVRCTKATFAAGGVVALY